MGGGPCWVQRYQNRNMNGKVQVEKVCRRRQVEGLQRVLYGVFERDSEVIRG